MRPSGKAAQKNLSEPRKKRKWQRKQGQIEPSLGISNELNQLGPGAKAPSPKSARCVRTPRTVQGSAALGSPRSRPGSGRDATTRGHRGNWEPRRLARMPCRGSSAENRTSPAQPQPRSLCLASRLAVPGKNLCRIPSRSCLSACLPASLPAERHHRG